MSWDLWAAKIPEHWQTHQEMPNGWDPPPIGVRSKIIESILQRVPNADFADPTRGCIEGPDYSIVVSLPGEEPLHMIGFFIRGGTEAAFVAADIISGLDLRAFDTGSANGTIFPGCDIMEGMMAWRRLREQLRGTQPAD